MSKEIKSPEQILAQRIVKVIQDGWELHSRNFTSIVEAERYWTKEIREYNEEAICQAVKVSLETLSEKALTNHNGEQIGVGIVDKESIFSLESLILKKLGV